MPIDYKIKKSSRSKRIAITVSSKGEVTATSPLYVSDVAISRFIESKLSWILKKIAYFNKKQFISLPKANKKDFEIYKESALLVAKEKVAFWNTYYKFDFDSISIKNQKTRWGSCSREGGLSFNYRIIFLSPELQDYLVVHELCHLKEFNHSKSFWDLVKEAIPEFKERRKLLKRHI